ncbi:MAG TPA: 2-oxo acid dehydrogenase subunit E2 [Herpetosiphonaceae bacterium]
MEITLPQLGDAVAEVTIERYYRQIGDPVEVGDPLVVVRSDRCEWDVPATAAGTIGEILAQPGSTIAVGAALVRLRGAAAESAAEPTTNGRVTRVTPVARKIAAVHGLDLAAVAGSGPGGAITRRDVFALVAPASVGAGAQPAFNSCFSLDIPTEATITAPRSATPAAIDEMPAAQTPPTSKAAPQQVALTDAQRAMAAQLVQDKSSIPHALTAVEVELSRVIAYVEAHRARLARRGIDLTITACIAHAAVAALTKHRLLNSVWSDEGIIVRGRVRLALAAGQGANSTIGLIPDAADLSLQGLARAIGSRQPADDVPAQVSAATFTICEEGTTRWRHAIVSAAQGAVLTIGAVERRPYVLEGRESDTIVIRPLVIATLAYDARCVTHVQADAFLIALKSELEHFSPL